MAKVKFSVACIATYYSELEIPDEIKNDEKEIIKYIRENLDNVKVQELEWLNDLSPEEAVAEEDVLYVE